MADSSEIFISWSGETSRLVAEELRIWLPLVLDSPKLWLSSRDLPDGSRWSQELFARLESSHFGVLVVTHQNIRSSWMMFEAGALSKSIRDGRVVPYLFGLRPSDLDGPLKHFQAIPADRDGTHRLVKAIQAILPTTSSNDILAQRFDAFWPQLDESLTSLAPETPTDDDTTNADQAIERLETRLSEQTDMIRELARRLNMWSPPKTDVPIDVKKALLQLEGAWRFYPTGSHGYAKVIKGDLHVAYCFAGNESLTGDFYDWRRVGDFWLARFKWVDACIQGFGLYRQLSADLLEGSWWQDGERSIEDVQSNLHDTIGGNPIRWERHEPKKVPEWALVYWNDLESSPDTSA